MILPASACATVALFAFTACLSGCGGTRGVQQNGKSVEQRRQENIEVLEENPQAWGKTGQLVWKELRRSSPESLERPRLVVVWVRDQETRIALVVEWLEAEPTPTAVRLWNPRSGFDTYVKFDATYQKAWEEIKEHSVRFSFTYQWDQDTPGFQRLYSELLSGHAKAQLLRDGKPVGNVVPVRVLAEAV